MSHRRGSPRVALFSHQGFVLRHVPQSEAFALCGDPCSGFEKIEIGGEFRIVKTDYQRSREESSCSITVTEMRLNAGEYGDPLPEGKRRGGYIDPIESARDKVSAWQGIGKLNVVEVESIPTATDNVRFTDTPKGSALRMDPVSKEVKDAWKLRLGTYYRN